MRIDVGVYSVDLYGASGSLVELLAENAAPYWSVEDAAAHPAPPTLTISMEENCSNELTFAPPGQEISLFGGPKAYRRSGLEFEVGGERWIQTSSATYAVVTERRVVRLYCAGSDREKYVALHRLLLCFWISRMEADGCVALHAAAVSKGDAAVLIVGRKGSGKTTCALNLMATYGYSLLSNDLILLGGAAPCGTAQISGIPESVRVGVGTMVSNTRLRNLLFDGRNTELLSLRHQQDERKKNVFISDLRKMELGAPVHRSAPLRAILFSELGERATNHSRIETVTRDASIDGLLAECLTPTNPTRPNWLKLDRAYHSKQTIRSELCKLIGEIASVRYQRELNADYNDLALFLHDLVKPTKR